MTIQKKINKVLGLGTLLFVIFMIYKIQRTPKIDTHKTYYTVEYGDTIFYDELLQIIE